MVRSLSGWWLARASKASKQDASAPAVVLLRVRCDGFIMLGEKADEKRNICGFIIEIFEPLPAHVVQREIRKGREAELLKSIKSASKKRRFSLHFCYC
jgi:hypothetical protein